MPCGWEAATPSLLFPSLVSKDKVENPEEYLKKFTHGLIGIQSKAVEAASSSKVSDLNQDQRPDLSTFELGDLVLYYQGHNRGQADKLELLWIGPFDVLFKCQSKYTIKYLKSRQLLSLVHRKFLKRYWSPESNLEESSVVTADKADNYMKNILLNDKPKLSLSLVLLVCQYQDLYQSADQL